MSNKHDCIIVGASFSGLACATVLARSGLNVKLIEKKRDAGEKLHTTGIIVKDAIDQIPLLDHLPSNLVKKITGVRLYAPNLRYVDLEAPGYYFLATDTPNVMRWLAAQAEEAGAHVAYQSAFQSAIRMQGGFDLGPNGTTRYLVGADGPNSLVAKTLGLGTSNKFLFGVEYELVNVELNEPNKLHCFFDADIAPGYIGWAVSGVGVVQIGIARRFRPAQSNKKAHNTNAALMMFLKKIKHIFNAPSIIEQHAIGLKPDAIRAGMIPCGGLVSPLASNRAMLVGDAAGMVSPVTAGGIHTALKHGAAAGHAIAEFIEGKADDPSLWFTRSYPRFTSKRILRFVFDHFQSDAIVNAFIGTSAVRKAAGLVYFHHKGVFD